MPRKINRYGMIIVVLTGLIFTFCTALFPATNKVNPVDSNLKWIEKYLNLTQEQATRIRPVLTAEIDAINIEQGKVTDRFDAVSDRTLVYQVEKFLDRTVSSVENILSSNQNELFLEFRSLRKDYPLQLQIFSARFGLTYEQEAAIWNILNEQQNSATAEKHTAHHTVKSNVSIESILTDEQKYLYLEYTKKYIKYTHVEEKNVPKSRGNGTPGRSQHH